MLKSYRHVWNESKFTFSSSSSSYVNGKYSRHSTFLSLFDRLFFCVLFDINILHFDDMSEKCEIFVNWNQEHINWSHKLFTFSFDTIQLFYLNWISSKVNVKNTDIFDSKRHSYEYSYFWLIFFFVKSMMIFWMKMMSMMIIMMMTHEIFYT